MKMFLWNDPLGRPECPYMHRYMINFGLFSIRLHVWHRSDDKRYMHDHSVSFITMVLKGRYEDVSMEYPGGPKIYDRMNRWAIRYRHADHLHYVHILNRKPTITLGLYGRRKRKWGFWVENEKHPTGRWFRPLRFFSRYGHPPCEEN